MKLLLIVLTSLVTFSQSHAQTVSLVGGRNTSGSTDGDALTQAQFNSPVDIAVAGDIIYVADPSNHKIREINLITQQVTTLAGDGASGHQDGAGASARFNAPSGVVVRGDSLYVADTGNHVIRVINLITKQVSTLAGFGTAGFADDIGIAAKFNAPVGIEIHGDDLYIGDRDNNAIRIINLLTLEVSTLAGNGSVGFVDGTGLSARFNAPNGVATVGDNVYIADESNNRIRIINLSTQETTTLAGDGSFSFGDGIGTNAKFNKPLGIAAWNQFLLIGDTDNNRIRGINLITQEVFTIAGDGSNGFQPGEGTGASLGSPSGLDIEDDILYVSLRDHNRIISIDLSSLAVTSPANATAVPANRQITLTWSPAPNASGYIIYRSRIDGFLPASTDSIAFVSSPDTMYTDAVLNNGTTYYYRIAEVDQNGDISNFSDQVSTAPLSPTISSGLIYWADVTRNHIQRALLDGTNIQTLATDISSASGIALDIEGGKLYWTDQLASRIQRANTDGSNAENLITTVLDEPIGIALDIESGKMYWTDIGSSRIQRANLNGTQIEDLITSDIDQPYHIALDLDGEKMYWTDNSQHRIQRADLNGTNVEILIFNPAPNPFQSTGIASPSGIALDIDAGKMYWSSIFNDIIHRANLDGTNVEEVFDTRLTSTDFPRPWSIALDIAGGKIYWPDLSMGILYRMSMDGENVESVLSDATSPRAIALDLSGAAPKPHITITGVTDTEGQSPFVFNVTLSFSVTQIVTVDYTTETLTAMDETGEDASDADFNKTEGTLIFNPGETEKTIEVPIIDDDRFEDIEQFYVNLSNPTNGIIVDAQVSGVIEDNDPPLLPAILTFENAFSSPGGQAIVNVFLEGTDEVAGLQFDVDTQVDGESSAFSPFFGAINPLELEDFSLSTGTSNANPTALLFNNSGGTVQTSADGKRLIIQLIYDIQPDTPNGTVIDLSISGTILSDAQAEPVDHQLIEGKLFIGIPGDVAGGSLAGGDGQIDVLDLVKTIQVILAILPEPASSTFQFFVMDTNGDMNIDILDVVSIVNEIVGEQPNPKSVATSAGIIEVALEKHLNREHGSYLVPLNLKSNGALSALEATFSFDPTVLQPSTPFLDTDNAHMEIASHMDENRLRVVIYSSDGRSIKAGEHSLLWIPVTFIEGEHDAGYLSMDEVLAGDQNARYLNVDTQNSQILIRSIPDAFSLENNRPNPFNPSTTISYEIPQESHITLTIYNMLGQKVRRLVDRPHTPGRYQVVWHGRNDQGNVVASGIYLYRLRSNNGFDATKRMLLLK